MLAVISALAAGLLQFERPHDRWKMYRGYQRQFEDERFRHRNSLAPYDDSSSSEDQDRLLGERVSELSARLHEDWSGLVPQRVEIPKSTQRESQ